MLIKVETKSLREAYGQCLVELGKRNKNVVVLEADLGKSTRTVLFKEAFPDRFFEMGIAEQNMASTAAGFALAGKIPFYNSFAVFASGRAFDQVRNSICIPKLKVRICGSSCGLSDFGDGKTHQSVEDIAILRAIPYMTVLSPADAVETVMMMEAMLDVEGPVYIRINRNDLPIVTPENEPYQIGKIWELRKGKDVAVFATGYMVKKALEAAEELSHEGIEVRVLNVSTIKPLDTKAVISLAKGVKAIVTVEEHSVIGGLGSAIAETLRKETYPPIEFIGIQDKFGTSAKAYEELLEAYGLTSKAIAGTVRSLVGR